MTHSCSLDLVSLRAGAGVPPRVVHTLEAAPVASKAALIDICTHTKKQNYIPAEEPWNVIQKQARAWKSFRRTRNTSEHLSGMFSMST